MTTLGPQDLSVSSDFAAQAFATTSSRAEAAARILGEIGRSSAPGARLGTKEELRARCEVSVGTFNEALKIAQNRGVIAMRPGPGGGIFSKVPSAIVRLGNLFLALDHDEETVAEAVHVRNALDRPLMDDAVEHRSDRDIKRLRQVCDEMRSAVSNANPDAFMTSNWRLHGIIAGISPNALMRSFYIGLLEIIEQHTLAVQPSQEQPLQAYIEYRLNLHERMVDAIVSQNLDEARALIEEHNTENYLSRAKQ